MYQGDEREVTGDERSFTRTSCNYAFYLPALSAQTYSFDLELRDLVSDQIWPKVTQQVFPEEPLGLQLYHRFQYFTMAWILYNDLHMQLDQTSSLYYLLQVNIGFPKVLEIVYVYWFDSNFLDKGTEVYREK